MTKQARVTAPQFTKIAHLVDGISALIQASIAKSKGVTVDIAAAEDELANALREFTLPALRIINCEPNGESEFKVTCCTCGATKPCTIHCKSWAASIRSTVGGSDGNVA